MGVIISHGIWLCKETVLSPIVNKTGFKFGPKGERGAQETGFPIDN